MPPYSLLFAWHQPGRQAHLGRRHHAYPEGTSQDPLRGAIHKSCHLLKGQYKQNHTNLKDNLLQSLGSNIFDQNMENNNSEYLKTKKTALVNTNRNISKQGLHIITCLFIQTKQDTSLTLTIQYLSTELLNSTCGDVLRLGMEYILAYPQCVQTEKSAWRKYI